MEDKRRDGQLPPLLWADFSWPTVVTLLEARAGEELARHPDFERGEETFLSFDFISILTHPFHVRNYNRHSGI